MKAMQRACSLESLEWVEMVAQSSLARDKDRLAGRVSVYRYLQQSKRQSVQMEIKTHCGSVHHTDKGVSCMWLVK